jgi:hypothetical protein
MAWEKTPVHSGGLDEERHYRERARALRRNNSFKVHTLMISSVVSDRAHRGLPAEAGCSDGALPHRLRPDEEVALRGTCGLRSTNGAKRPDKGRDDAGNGGAELRVLWNEMNC